MRYEKRVFAPDGRYAAVRVDPSRPQDGATAALYNMRPTNTGLVCGEGYETVCVLLAAATRIYVLDGEIYAYLSDRKGLYEIGSQTVIGGIATEPKALLRQTTEAGVQGVYCVEQGATRYLKGGKVQWQTAVGGTCAAMHHGRLFSADGLRLRFSAPFSEEGLTQSDRDPDKAAYIDLDEGKGKIVAVVSFRDKLYLFRERGIVKMRAEGEALDFCLTEMPFAGGKIIEGSVAACGEEICYMTADGLFAFDGNSCSFLGYRNEIDFTAAVTGFGFRGKYAAAVTLKMGQKGLYVYDFLQKKGRFLLENGLVSAAGENFLIGSTVYRFTENGGLPFGRDCSLELTLPSSPSGALAWVRVEGYGSFALMTNAKAGKTFTAKSGEKVKICAQSRSAETMLSLVSKDPSFRIIAVEAAWRKSDDD